MSKFAETIMKKYTLYAPIIKNDIPMFKKIAEPKNITLDFLNAVMSPKELFFGQTETLFSFTMGKEVTITPMESSEKAVILGIRPCDAKSLSLIDAVFGENFEDTYYTQKRQNTILIGLACNEPGLNCFCTSVKGSPTGTDNLDVMLTDLGDKYLVEALTEKGQDIVKETKENFQDASEADEKTKKQLQKEALEKFTRNLDVEGVETKLNELFENDVWDEISRICIGCSICTFMCPACHCFDIQDECAGYEGCRIRVWDTCSNPEYTLHASGHNPRPARTERVRNKILHKFSYLPKNVNLFGCVGCGRCIECCPENWDIIDAIEKVKEAETG